MGSDEYSEKMAAILAQRSFLDDTIELVRQSMGAADCETCKRRWVLFMGAMEVALHVGAFAAFANIDVTWFTQQVQTGKLKGHAKA